MMENAMRFDFETIMDRRGKDALAVDAIGAEVDFTSAPTSPREGFTPIPMWVADMNFATVPAVQREVTERVAHPTFGYFLTRPEYYDAIIRWHALRKGVTGIRPENIGYENGVLGCVCTALQAFTTPGERVLMHSPAYIGFTHSLEDTGRKAELSPLILDEQGIWRMDYEDMDRRLKQHHIHLAIFCSPHNPSGRVWERWEIERAMEVFRENDCVVLSDEIWSDILLNGHRHIPTQSVSDDAKMRTIAAYAPSKTFNLAGLIGSYHVIYNRYLKDRMDRQSRLTHYNDMNVLSMYALIGAYSDEGMAWTDELCGVLSDNINYAYDFITRNFDGVSTHKPEGTYLMLLDCEDFLKKKGMTLDELILAGWEVGVAWQDGRPFHAPAGIRMNFALPHSLVKEAMERLKTYVFKG